MGRVTDGALAKVFDTAFADLAAPTRSALVDGLSVDGTDDGTAVIPYYFPAMFANTLRGLKDKTDRSRSAAVGALYRLLARVFAGTKPRPGLGAGLIVECNMEFAQTVVKAAEFQRRPAVLDSLQIPADAYNTPQAKWV